MLRYVAKRGSVMWDLQTALEAVVVVAAGSLLVPPVARVVGGFCAFIGFFGVMQGRPWAPTVAALGLLAWFVGHWSYAFRNDVRYRSRIALWVIDRTPLRWTLPQYWRRRRAAPAR